MLPLVSLIFSEINSLDEISSKARSGLYIQISTTEFLENIQDALKNSKSGGEGVTFITRLQDGREVDIKLKGGYAITPDILQTLRNIPGIEKLSEK